MYGLSKCMLEVKVHLTGGILSVWLVLLPEKSLSLWLVVVVQW